MSDHLSSERPRRGRATAGASRVPEAERDQVFTPFHRLGGAGKGAGLGLALVREIAAARPRGRAPRPAEPVSRERAA